MTLTDKEELLIKKLAQAYAFISDLREEGIKKIDTFLIRKTVGINEQIEQLSLEFPEVFSKHYGEAKKRVTAGEISRGNEKDQAEKSLLEKGKKTKAKRKTTRRAKPARPTVDLQDKVQKE